MSLDFAILDKNGKPSIQVAMGAQLHGDVISVAQKYGLNIFLRFKDYYADANVSHDELNAFTCELETLQLHAFGASSVEFLKELKHLIQRAKTSGRGLAVIAD
jgi:hypothetical protein